MKSKRLSNRRLANFRKLDPLTRAISEMLFHIDPLGLSKLTQHLDEYSGEAKEIVKRLGSARDASPHQCGQVCWKVFCEYFSEQEANSCKEWNKLGEAIHWLINNEGMWTL